VIILLGVQNKQL